MKYRIYDTFNDRTISTHRTPKAAVKAEVKFLRAVRRSNGQSSYIPTLIEVLEAGEWAPVDHDQLIDARLKYVR